VYINNHTSVWGSYFDRDTALWGFACCHSLIAGSYCTGEAGKVATTSSSVTALLDSASERRRIDEEAEAERATRKTLAEQHADNIASASGKDKEKDKDKGKKADRAEIPTYGKRPEEGDEVELDKDRLRKALAEEKKRKKMGEDEAWAQSKKSKIDVSQEELGECHCIALALRWRCVGVAFLFISNGLICVRM
jgi:pre-mRNA-processing factor SLU7